MCLFVSQILKIMNFLSKSWFSLNFRISTPMTQIKNQLLSMLSQRNFELNTRFGTQKFLSLSVCLGSRLTRSVPPQLFMQPSGVRSPRLSCLWGQTPSGHNRDWHTGPTLSQLWSNFAIATRVRARHSSCATPATWPNTGVYAKSRFENLWEVPLAV